MAIKPKGIFDQREADAKAEADALEAKIDRWLTANYEPGQIESFRDLDGVSQRARVAIICRYDAAGWEVTYHDDQRAGESLRFKPRGGR